MLQNTATSKESYDRFVERVLESGEVYGLQSPDGGWAVCPSHEVKGASVIVFWSDRAYAARHQKEDWSDYAPAVIPLEEFIDAWLKGMHEDGSMVGPNWDANLCGLEVTPAAVAKRLTEE
jgi:hypothetical protein